MDNLTQHRMWLDDPVTESLINHCDNHIKRLTQQVFSIRRTNPSLLPDLVAELELATAMRENITTGKFIN